MTPFGASSMRHSTAMTAAVNSHGRMYSARKIARGIRPISSLFSSIANVSPSTRWATTLVIVKTRVFEIAPRNPLSPRIVR